MDEWTRRLFESAKKGHLCERIDDPSLFPPELLERETSLVLQGNRLYLQRNWALESLLLGALSKLLERRPQPLHDEGLFAEAFSQTKPSLQPAQQRAIQTAFGQTLSIFTGGPGTGKTFTASTYIRLLASSIKGPLFKVAIAAPTGRAAAHLEAALQAQGVLPKSFHCESTTLHRLLRLRPGMQRLNETVQIDAHLVVIDEASMLDVSLMLHLFKAIGPQTRLLLLGDPDQLPPIDGASLFPDLAKTLGCKLERSMRVDAPELLRLTEAIQRGDLQEILQTASFLPLDVEPLKRFVPSPIATNRPDPLQCLVAQKERRILSALRQGPYGADALNRLFLTHFEAQRKPGDWLCLPILVTENAAKQQLYNGTTGILIHSPDERSATAYFATGSGVFALPEAALPHYEVAFCLSVHKSQGSEFDEVVALFPSGSEQLGKEALYTAATRAKKTFALAIDPATLATLLRTSAITESGFRERFIDSRL